MVISGRRVLVLAGRGRYEDPWHDHAGTSDVVAGLLRTLPGVRVEVRGLFPDAVRDLDAADLLVVNTGRGRPDPAFDGDDADWVPVHEHVARWCTSGGAVLALHQAANTFPDAPRWEEVLGGRWIPGESTHPPIGETVIAVRTDVHPVVAGLGDVAVFDERYCRLRTSPDATVLATAHHDGVDHPVAWVHERHGGRTVYDGLGHDVRSYDSRSRRELLLRSASWLLRPG